MELFKNIINVKTDKDKTSYINITDEINKIIAESQIKDGICAVISPHTTCSVFFEEFSHDYFDNGDEYLQRDLNNVLKKIIPDHDSKDVYNYPGEKHYEEVESWPDADSYLPNGDRSMLWNGDAHLKATVIGSSEVFDVENNKLGVGITGYVYFADFDTTRERNRRVKVIVLGNR